MDLVYRPLFLVSASHEFFGGDDAGLSLAPSASCAALLRQYRLLTRFEGGGLAIWRGETQGGPEPDWPEGGTSFSFLVRAAPATIAVTAPDWRGEAGPGSLVAVSNLDMALDEPNRWRAPSSAGAALPIRPPRFSLADDRATAPGPRIVRWPGGDAVWEGAAPKARDVDLSHYPEGRYALQADLKVLEEFYMLRGASAGLLGAVDIVTGAAAKGSGPSGRADEALARYEVTFAAVAATWRYTVFAPSNRADFSDARIESDAAWGAFDGPEQTIIRGRSAWRFASTTPIALRSKPPSNAKPRLAYVSGDAPASAQLPHAGADSLRRDEASGETIAEMFVYL